MFKAVLFDLDGTLLNIDMDVFLGHYFKKMQEIAVKEGFPEDSGIVERIFKSTGVMIDNRDPQSSNEEVFMQDFLNSWQYPKEQVQAFFNKFYEQGFPQLRSYCQPFPGIPEMMENLFSRDLKVIIATNAVFPMTALQQRLDWAGVGHFNYDLITSYELMHFCKPHQEYYEEITEQIGVDPKDCLMVGNDKGEDLPAGKVGMKTFLVEDMLIDNGSDLQPDWSGSLQEFLAFMKKL
ncbi:MAG: HAD family hydrolase [Syntrophomonas sp.]